VSRRAFSLVEMVCACGLSLVLLGLAVGAWSAAGKSVEGLSREVDRQARFALVHERMVRRLRRSCGFATPENRPGRIVLYRTDWGSPALDGAFELRSSGELVQKEAGREMALGKNVGLRSLEFSVEPDPQGVAEPRLLSIRAWLTPESGRPGTVPELITRVYARGGSPGILHDQTEEAN
jgi:hypothetical protein